MSIYCYILCVCVVHYVLDMLVFADVTAAAAATLPESPLK